MGSAGDISDHPQAVEIVQMFLDATKKLNEKRLQKENETYQIKIFTNYRPHNEQILNDLIDLAIKNPRMRLTISLPKNKVSTVHQKFKKFIATRPDVFIDKNKFDEDEIPNFSYSEILQKNIGVQDVLHYHGKTNTAFTHGRILKGAKGIANDDQESLIDRGNVKIHLNPDALWLQIYGSIYESHTRRIFTRLTAGNLNYLNRLPFHPDFPTPPYWPGGQGKLKDILEVGETIEIIRKALSNSKALKIIQ